MYARPIYRPVQVYNSENKCFLPIITAKAVVDIHINIYELSYAAWPGCLSLYSMKECQNAQPCLLSNYIWTFVVLGYCCDDEMTSQQLPSRESSTQGTHKPIGERFSVCKPFSDWLICVMWRGFPWGSSPWHHCVNMNHGVEDYEGPGPVSYFSPYIPSISLPSRSNPTNRTYL